MPPLVSVIVSTLNDPLLASCLESLSNQSFKDFKVYLINDGGSDISSIVNQFPDLSIDLYHETKTIGLSGRLNQAISYVDTKYIARMDSDDYCLPDRLLLQLKYLEENNYDIIGSSIISRTGSEQESSYKISKILSNKLDIIKSLGFRSPLAHPTFFGKTELFKTIKYNTNILYGQDHDFLIRAFLDGYSIGNLTIPLLVYNSSSPKSYSKILYQMSIANQIAKAYYLHNNRNLEYSLNPIINPPTYYDILLCRFRSIMFTTVSLRSFIILIYPIYIFLSMFSTVHREFNLNILFAKINLPSS